MLPLRFQMHIYNRDSHRFVQKHRYSWRVVCSRNFSPALFGQPDASQRFSFIKGDDGFCTIRNTSSQLVLDVDSARAANGTRVQQYKANGTDDQKWELISNAGPGSRAQMASGLRLMSHLRRQRMERLSGSGKRTEARRRTGRSLSPRPFRMAPTRSIPALDPSVSSMSQTIQGHQEPTSIPIARTARWRKGLLSSTTMPAATIRSRMQAQDVHSTLQEPPPMLAQMCSSTKAMGRMLRSGHL